MSILSHPRDPEYLWMEFIFGPPERAGRTLDLFHEVVTREGHAYRFIKGNDSQLNYTLLDWQSGRRWMLDIYDSVRRPGGRAARKHELVMASYDSGLALPDGAAAIFNPHAQVDELLLFLQYNGVWTFGRETFSLVLFLFATGALGTGDREEQRENFRRMVRLCRELWRASSPLFLWMDVSSYLSSESVEQVVRGKPPSAAWISITSSSIVRPEMAQAADETRSLVCERLDDGALLIENARSRRGQLRYY